MNMTVTFEIWHKGNYYVAKCPELDFMSQGQTAEDAKRNLLEVIEIQFEEMTAMGTLYDYLSECGYIRKQQTLIPQIEMVGLEKHAVQVA